MSDPVKAARPRGRPAGGITKIDAAAVERLPESGSANEFARVLGVTASTMQRWINLEGAPAERGEVARWTLNRDSFSEWLKIKGKIHGDVSGNK